MFEPASGRVLLVASVSRVARLPSSEIFVPIFAFGMTSFAVARESNVLLLADRVAIAGSLGDAGRRDRNSATCRCPSEPVGPPVAHPLDHVVEHRRQEDAEERHAEHAAEDGRAQRPPHLGTGARRRSPAAPRPG